MKDNDNTTNMQRSTDRRGLADHLTIMYTRSAYMGLRFVYRDIATQFKDVYVWPRM